MIKSLQPHSNKWGNNSIGINAKENRFFEIDHPPLFIELT